MCKDPPARLQNHLEALAAFSSVLLEPLNGELLDTVLDLLPAAT